MLEARHLTLAVAHRTLVRELDLACADGETWGILGANGSGKTSLLHVLAGLRPATQGEVCLHGVALSQLPARERARSIAVLFQDGDPALATSVHEFVLTGRHPHRGRFAPPDTTDLEQVATALADVGLTGFAPRALTTLSGGERRRADIAAVLAQRTPVLLLDEPTNHLDPRHQLALLARLTAAGRLRLMVLHDANLARRFCTHTILLFEDATHLCGPVAQVLTRPNLERLYGCALRELRDDDRIYFIPH